MDKLAIKYKTIRIVEQKEICFVQIYRPEANNSINTVLIEEMTELFMAAEEYADIKVIVLEGLPDNFCTGMDFRAVSNNSEETIQESNTDGYYNLLKHFSTCSKVIITKVEGKVNAGGIGLVAASDIVIADAKATFGLSEALFGLLPAMVMPFLIRRIGFQKAQWMTLITQGISADRAHQIGLADEVSTNASDAVRKILLRLIRLETETIQNIKDYMSKLWIINDQTQQLAVGKISSLMNSEKVQSNIKNFIQNGKFPWDK